MLVLGNLKRVNNCNEHKLVVNRVKIKWPKTTVNISCVCWIRVIFGSE